MTNQLEFYASGWFKITPSNTLTIDQDPNAPDENAPKKVYVKNNTDAAIAVKMTNINNQDETINIAPYFIEPIAVKKIWLTGTDTITAGDLIAYY